MFDPSSSELTVEQVAFCNQAGVTVPAVRAEWALFPDATFEIVVGNVLAHQQHVADGIEDAPVPETTLIKPEDLEEGTVDEHGELIETVVVESEEKPSSKLPGEDTPTT